MSETVGGRFYAAELLRMQAEVLAGTGERAMAEERLRESIEAAQRQGQPLFVLRRAAGLCRLLEGSRREAALREVLRPLYERFNGPDGAPDLRDAAALLAPPVDA